MTKQYCCQVGLQFCSYKIRSILLTAPKPHGPLPSRQAADGQIQAGICKLFEGIPSSFLYVLALFPTFLASFITPHLAHPRGCSFEPPRQTSDEQGAHVQFVVRTQVEETHEAWEVPRRYRDFTQLRKRMLRLGIDVPTATATAGGKDGGAGGPALVFGPDLPKKTWRSDKFDKGHLDARRAALEAYLQGAVTVRRKSPRV